MQEYETIEGDVIDQICHATYGTEYGTTEAVLAANPGLADHGGRLPAGIIILLPDMQPTSTVKMLSLWD